MPDESVGKVKLEYEETQPRRMTSKSREVDHRPIKEPVKSTRVRITKQCNIASHKTQSGR
jgi:hypothetical protein